MSSIPSARRQWAGDDLVGESEVLQLLQAALPQRLVERIALARSDMAVAVHVAQQPPDAGQPLLPDLVTKPVLDLEVGPSSEVKRDQLGGALAHVGGQILAGDDQVPPAIVPPAHDDVDVGCPVL
jgi:hypothetical protein